MVSNNENDYPTSDHSKSSKIKKTKSNIITVHIYIIEELKNVFLRSCN